MRAGKHTGAVQATRGPHGGLVLNLQWGAPLPGIACDEFVLAPAGTAAAAKGLQQRPAAASKGQQQEQELHVYSALEGGGGRSARYRTVYRRA